jgi:beta-glucosidase
MPFVLLVILVFGLIFSPVANPYYLPKDIVKKDIYHDGWIDFNKNSIMDPYENPKLPIEQRVDDLLKRMTLNEKIYQLQSGGDPPVGNLIYATGGYLPREGAIRSNGFQRRAIEGTRLGIPVTINESALHGIVARGCTSFPQAIGLAATWDPSLMYRVAKAIGKEARARGINQALDPVVNIARDIRAGRTEETYGEDPYLTSMMGAAFCKALREEGVIVTPKHYAANFVGDGGRDSNEIHLSERILREIYFPGFHSCFKAGALSVMSAYNSIDGIPCSSNEWLLKEVLKWEWGFPGFVVSDWGAAAGVFHSHRVASTLEEASALCLKGGLDVEQPSVYLYGNPLMKAIQQGMIPQKDLDDAVRRVLRAKFLIGLFDNPYANPDEAQRICGSNENAQLALEAARKAIVLLKNEGNLLPLDKNKIKRIAVLGPVADQVRLGGYSGEPPRGVSPLEGIRNAVNPGTEVVFVRGCNLELKKGEFPKSILEAAEEAKKSDVAIVFVGIREGEGQDRAHINLPGFQEELINEVVKTGTPAVVVIIAGSAVTGDWIDYVPAILMAWYPGQEGGTAIAETLFGENNPGGKLPFTWPRYVGQLPLYYNFKPTGRGYDYIDMPGWPLFPFGHGLSYTKFEYKNLKIEADENRGNVMISFEVSNVGDREGEEVAQLYLHDVIASLTRPVMELKRFKRIKLAPSESTVVRFQLTPDDLAFYDINMRKVVEPGDFEVMVGSSAGDIRLRGSFKVNSTIRTSFECSLFSPEKVKAKAGELVRISLLVSNKGTISDLCPIYLYLNGKLLESHKVDLSPKERRAVDFWVEVPKPGKYEVKVGIPEQMRKVVLEAVK